MNQQSVSDTFRGRNVLITGHTGFKGGWLSFLLKELGVKIYGISNSEFGPRSSYKVLLQPGAFEIESVGPHADIGRDGVFEKFLSQIPKMDFVFHLAAQPLVLVSYENPLGTFEANVLGTARVLESLRKLPEDLRPRGVLVVTSDKCYENPSYLDGSKTYHFQEGDRLGGHDPYSASKAAAELIAQSYRRSYFPSVGMQIVTARAGNVIGGGDDSLYRILPDAVRAWSTGRVLEVRQPDAVRPWQDVLDPVFGYLLVARELLRGSTLDFAFNFGPDVGTEISVKSLILRFQEIWKRVHETEAPVTFGGRAGFSEAKTLGLDSSKARRVLNWKPKISLSDSLCQVAKWYSPKSSLTDLRVRAAEEANLLFSHFSDS